MLVRSEWFRVTSKNSLGIPFALPCSLAFLDQICQMLHLNTIQSIVRERCGFTDPFGQADGSTVPPQLLNAAPCQKNHLKSLKTRQFCPWPVLINLFFQGLVMVCHLIIKSTAASLFILKIVISPIRSGSLFQVLAGGAAS